MRPLSIRGGRALLPGQGLVRADIAAEGGAFSDRAAPPGALALDAAGIARGHLFGAILFGINVVLMGVILFALDKGRLVSPAYARLAQERVARLRADLEATAPTERPSR
mgnify:CR=1 FL=1